MQLRTKDDVRLILLALDQLVRLNIIDFDKLQLLVLDPELRKQLKDNSKFHQQYSKLYAKSIDIYAQIISQRSRCLFVAIPREEMLDLKIDQVADSHFAKMIENFNNLSTEVNASIIKQNSFQKAALTFERWIYIMRRCLQLYDFNSAIAIFAALNSTALTKLKVPLSTFAKDSLDYMQILTADKNISENLRDAVNGHAIPALYVYKTIIIHAKEGSSGHYRLEEHEAIINLIQSISEMQKLNKPLLPKVPPVYLSSSNLYHEILHIADTLKLVDGGHKYREIMQLANAATSVDEKIKVQDEILYQVAKCLRDSQKSTDAKDLKSIHEINEKISLVMGYKDQSCQEKFEATLFQLRDYVRTETESDHPEVIKLKQHIKESIKELRLIIPVTAKIEYLTGEITKLENLKITSEDSKIAAQVKVSIINPLKKLCDVLTEKESLDSYREHIITRKERRSLKAFFDKQGGTNLTTSAAIRQTLSNEILEQSHADFRLKHLLPIRSNKVRRIKSEEQDQSNLERNNAIYKRRSSLPVANTHIAWTAGIKDNEYRGVNSPMISPETRRLHRASLNLGTDYKVADRTRDKKHLEDALIESNRENRLRKNARPGVNSHMHWSESTRPSPQFSPVVSPRMDAAVIKTITYKNDPVTNAALKPQLPNVRTKNNKLRWSWPLHIDNTHAANEEEPGMIVIRVPAKYYK